MRNSMIAAFAVLGFSGAAPAVDSYTLDPNHTFPRFEISHLGFSTHHSQFNKTASVRDIACRK